MIWKAVRLKSLKKKKRTCLVGFLLRSSAHQSAGLFIIILLYSVILCVRFNICDEPQDEKQAAASFRLMCKLCCLQPTGEELKIETQCSSVRED